MALSVLKRLEFYSDHLMFLKRGNLKLKCIRFRAEQNDLCLTEQKDRLQFWSKFEQKDLLLRKTGPQLERGVFEANVEFRRRA